MELDLERVRANVRAATTEDLLDRVTVFRAGMELEALEIIEAELADRGIDADAVAAHAVLRRAALPLPDGTAMKCSFCHRPAVLRAWGWHHWWGLIPIFPRIFAYCDIHGEPRRHRKDT